MFKVFHQHNHSVGCDRLANKKLGHLKQKGALTITNFCDHCQSFPLSDCTWYVHQQKLEKQRQQFVLWQVRAHLQFDSRQVVGFWR